jgi:hypothetical protein
MFYFFFLFFSLAVPFVNDFLVVHLLHLTLVTSRNLLCRVVSFMRHQESVDGTVVDLVAFLL